MHLLEIINKTNENIDEEWFVSVFNKIIDEIEEIYNGKDFHKNPPRVNLCFIDDLEIKKLNKKYRGIDRVTDVLSFTFAVDDDFILPPDDMVLGEIFISINQAKKQANLFKKTIREEMTFLFIHGVLHLLGYDHETVEERRKMKKIESYLLKKINVQSR